MDTVDSCADKRNEIQQLVRRGRFEEAEGKLASYMIDCGVGRCAMNEYMLLLAASFLANSAAKKRGRKPHPPHRELEIGITFVNWLHSGATAELAIKRLEKQFFTGKSSIEKSVRKYRKFMTALRARFPHEYAALAEKMRPLIL